jgi:hypothetical protein
MMFEPVAFLKLFAVFCSFLFEADAVVKNGVAVERLHIKSFATGVRACKREPRKPRVESG